MSDNHKAALIADALTKQVQESSKPKVAYVVLSVSWNAGGVEPVAVFYDEDAANHHAESLSEGDSFVCYGVFPTPIM